VKTYKAKNTYFVRMQTGFDEERLKILAESAESARRIALDIWKSHHIGFPDICGVSKCTKPSSL
jgi:hypothetical protein